jgi:uncharacterized protein
VRAKILNETGERSYALIFDSGDEPIALLTRFAEEHRISAARFTAIGAFSDAVVGYFDWQRKDYERIAIPEQVEVLALVGDIALAKGKPKVHAHVVLGKRDATAHGGHLLEARVRPTLEVVLTESASHLVREHDPQSGLALIRIEAAGRSR